MLKIKSLNTYYGNLHALKGVDLTVKEGEIVTLIGSNGAGKSTTLLTVAGMLKPSPDSEIEFEGKSIAGVGPTEIVKRGVILSPEGREVFPGLSVEMNLEIGAYPPKAKKEVRESFAGVYEPVPPVRGGR